MGYNDSNCLFCSISKMKDPGKVNDRRLSTRTYREPVNAAAVGPAFGGRSSHSSVFGLWRKRGDQTACKPGSVPPALRRTRRPFLWTGHCWPVLATYPDGSGRRGPAGARRRRRVVPIRSCSKRGLPCRPRRRVRGGLLPHPFTLTLRADAKGGLLSVALSLGSPPAGVTRRLFAVEPGLSSLLAKPRERPPGRLIRREGGPCPAQRQPGLLRSPRSGRRVVHQPGVEDLVPEPLAPEGVVA
jgi:hypothetical protein